MPDFDERFGDDLQAVITIITTEHSALETTRSATIFEANGRVASYLATLSGAVVALAFIGDAAAFGGMFDVFLLVLLPTLLFIGIVTFKRVLESGTEDGILASRVNRLRRFYMEFRPELSDYLSAPAHDDKPSSALRQAGTINSQWQLLFTAAGMVAIVNSIVAGILVGAVAHMLTAALPWSVALGGGAFVAVAAAHYRHQAGVWAAAERTAGEP